jgi:hypothetical protein
MPMPKPEKPEDLRINGRSVKTLDIKVEKLHKTDSSVANRMAELAAAKKAEEGVSKEGG